MKNKPGQNRNYAEKNQNAMANSRREMEAAEETGWKDGEQTEHAHAAGKDAQKQTPQGGASGARKPGQGNYGNK